MKDKRIQFSNIVKNQLPAYVREEFPLVSEFLSQYYLSQEVQSAPVDLIQNIDQYVKIDNVTNLTDSTILLSDILSTDETIVVDLGLSPEGISGFPDSYGLIQIDDEIITYTGKTNNSFIIQTAQVYELTGKLVLNSEVINATINVEFLTKGTYILKVTDSKGKVYSQKFNKE